MLKKNVFFTLLFFAFLIASGQEGLLIKNTKNGKAWMYEKKAKITYIKFGEDEYATKTLNALLDSAVVFGNDTVMLCDIAGIRKKNSVHKIVRIIGMPLMLIGSLFMSDGILSMFLGSDSDSGIKFFLTGAGIFALGYLPYKISMEDLTIGIGGEWTIRISRE